MCGGVESKDGERPRRDRRDGADHAHRAALPGTIWAKKPKHLALFHGEVDSMNRSEVAETLREVVGDHGVMFRHQTTLTPGSDTSWRVSPGIPILIKLGSWKQNPLALARTRLGDLG